MKTRTITTALIAALAAPAALAGHHNEDGAMTFEVSGEAIHYFTTAVQHSRTEREGGETLRSTDIIELTGDLSGKVLYHPVTEIDFAAMTLTNTGTQVFSGTIAGSEPVLILDDKFKFQVNLENGALIGQVYLDQTLSGPDITCEIEIVGTGQQTPDGDGIASYSGTCSGPGL